MSRYGKIESGFWHNPKVRALSERGRLLLAYMFSCPHGNSCGCFVLPDGYVATDMGWPIETVTQTISELFDNGFLERDEPSNLIRIVGWWGHNGIANPKVAQFVAKEVAALPNCLVRQHLIENLLSLTRLHEKVIETLSERLPKPFRNQEHNNTIQEPNITNQSPTVVGVEFGKSKSKKSEAEFETEFGKFYDAYPRHDGKGSARKAYRAARNKIDAESLLAAAQAARTKYATTEPKFIPMPATWLNREGWLDEGAQKSRAETSEEAAAYRGIL